MDAIKNAFRGFDLNDMDFANAGNWPIGVKVVSYLLLVIVICAAGWHFYAADKRVALQREVTKEAALKNTYKAKAFQVANLDALRKQMADVEGKFAELLKQLPTEKEVPGLLDDITSLGKDSGLDIGSIALAAEFKNKFYIELPININVQGSYHQLGQFVSGVAGLSRIVTLHDYSIQPGAGGVSMRISAKTYRFDNTK
jgi:type IV pilus assembly protein PilO